MRFLRDLTTAVRELRDAVQDLRVQIEAVAKLVVAMDNHRRWEQRLLDVCRDNQRLIKDLYYDVRKHEKKEEVAA